VIDAEKWVPITVVIHHVRGLSVYAGDKPVCSDARNSEKAEMEDKDVDLIAGGADGEHTCSGSMAHLYYIPQTVTRKEVHQHGEISPLACKRPKNDALELA